MFLCPSVLIPCGPAARRLKISFSGAADILAAVLGKHAYFTLSGQGDSLSDRIVVLAGTHTYTPLQLSSTHVRVRVRVCVQEYVFSTMIGMCLDKVGQSRLGTVGIGKLAVASVYRYEKALTHTPSATLTQPGEYALLLSCALVSNLAVHSPVSQAKLRHAGNLTYPDKALSVPICMYVCMYVCMHIM